MKKLFYIISSLTVLSLLVILSASKPRAVKAIACGGTFPPGVAGGVDRLQQQINNAKSGAVINLPAGTYSGPNAVPIGLGNSIFVSADRGASETCMIRIENKTLTLKGAGPGETYLYGEGHAKPDQPPYKTRAGICIINSKVTVDNLTIQEFQKRCAVVYNSQVTVKNSVVAGCDEGGFSLLGNSSGLFVNNSFAEMNFGGVMLWQNSVAKIVNNNFYNAALLYFYHPGTNDQARADIINNIFSAVKSDITQVDWWKADPAQLQSNRLSYDLVYRSADQTCDPSFQLWCGNYKGKITADPLYNSPATDPCGIAPQSDFSLKAGSPAVGVGDPTIPGPKNLGVAGGPCTDGNSAICSQFIAGNVPAPVQPPPQNQNPTPVNQAPPGGTTTSNIGIPDIYSSTITQFSTLLGYLLHGVNFPNYGLSVNQTNQPSQTGISFTTFVILAVVFIMVIHFAVGITNEFNVFLMIGYFVFGGVVGWWFGTYESGLVLAIILTLLFW